MGGTLWLPGPPQMPEAVGQSRTLLVSKGWHKWKQSDMEGIMAIADVIIVNYGLHYAVRHHLKRRWRVVWTSPAHVLMRRLRLARALFHRGM